MKTEGNQRLERQRGLDSEGQNWQKAWTGCFVNVQRVLGEEGNPPGLHSLEERKVGEVGAWESLLLSPDRLGHQWGKGTLGQVNKVANTSGKKQKNNSTNRIFS